MSFQPDLSRLAKAGVCVGLGLTRGEPKNEETSLYCL